MLVNETQGYSPQEQIEHPADNWETVTLNGEVFKVKRDLAVPMRYKDQEVVFRANEYHHLETGTQITVLSLGMDQPVSEPAPVRADYGCPCMSFGPEFAFPGHDCGPQRNMMLKTIADIGIGAIAIVSEQTAAGNGHGAHVVFEQSNRQYEARQNGEPVPTMPQFYSEQGYFPFDTRRHDLVGFALVDTIGQERPVIPAMASQMKIDQLANAGLFVLPNTRIDLHTGVHDVNLRRDNYAESIKYPKVRPYLVTQDANGGLLSVPLTPETYRLRFQTPHLTTPGRRIPN